MVKKRQKIRKSLILISFLLFPVTFYYLSPVLIVQASAQGIINGSFIVFLLLFCASLLLGRGFCGWVCPGAGCQEAFFGARDKDVKRGGLIKWVVWIPWVSAIALLAIRQGGYRKVDFLYQTNHGVSINGMESVIAYYSVLFILIVIPALLVGKRSFCHHLCWMAPFMILGRKFRNSIGWKALQLKSIPEECNHCKACTKNCPMSLPVEEMVGHGFLEHVDCILCGSCIDACRFQAIRFQWGHPKTVSAKDLA